MEKNIKTFILIFIIFMFNLNTVSAIEKEINNDMITNSELTIKFMEKAPSELKNLFDEENLIISTDWFDKNGELLPLIGVKEIYIETSTFKSSIGQHRTIEKQITSQEYNTWEPPVQTRASCGSVPFQYHDCWETNAKRLTIAIMGSSTNWQYAKIAIINEWKTMPNVRSFDSIGLLYNGFVMTNAWGYQYYNTTSNHALQKISYGYKGANMKISNNSQGGVAISQNIIDNLYNKLRNELWVEGKIANNSPYQFTASYQHAVSSINLAISHNFTFHANGMGRVFSWGTSWNKWDNMQGVCVNLSYPTLWFC